MDRMHADEPSVARPSRATQSGPGCACLASLRHARVCCARGLGSKPAWTRPLSCPWAACWRHHRLTVGLFDRQAARALSLLRQADRLWARRGLRPSAIGRQVLTKYTRRACPPAREACQRAADLRMDQTPRSGASHLRESMCICGLPSFINGPSSLVVWRSLSILRRSFQEPLR